MMPGANILPLPFLKPPRPAASGYGAAVGATRRAAWAAVTLITLGACQALEARAPAIQQSPDSVRVAAAGDLVCGAATPLGIPCLHVRTADVVRRLKPDALLLLGDLQYETGSAEDFGAYFDPAFGEFKSITYPVPGNHEYMTRGAPGYFDYFNGVAVDSGRAGSRSRGYYSFDLGAWHIVALNTNCIEIGGCGARSPQAQWLKADLAEHRRMCTLAFAHSARFSSGEHGNDPALRDLWQVLYDGGVDVVLAGHDHHYERFGPQDASGRADAERGIRSFVVGTGGKGTGRFIRPRQRNSEIRDNNSIGVLLLTLRREDYTWRFVPVPGHELADSGSANCRE